MKYYFLTFVTHRRLAVFKNKKICLICCNALAEAAKSADFKIVSYVIMPDHIHIITTGNQTPKKILQYLKGISARRVVDYLKENKFFASLKKLDVGIKQRNYKYSLWQHHSNTRELSDKSNLVQKVNYIHQNPVKDNLADSPGGYLFSSSRIWEGSPLRKEPLEVDTKA